MDAFGGELYWCEDEDIIETGEALEERGGLIQEEMHGLVSVVVNL